MNELINNAEFILAQLHFLRAGWFYAFIPLLMLLLLLLKKTQSNKKWRNIIDAQLQPFVLHPSPLTKQRRYPLLLTFIAASLCITALAGPTYKKLPQPVYREQSSLVVLLDLSQSMNATDIKPSRLQRAKLELLDILQARKTGQTALIVYAADAFVVTPLTDDNATIANLVPSLQTEMMPAQGSNLSRALSKTFSLFTQAGIIHGDILVITDGIHTRDEAAIEKVRSLGHRLSIFGIGTAEGSPIPLDGGFLQDKNGAIVIPGLQREKLQRYALKGGGLYTGIAANDDDINKLSALFQSSEVKQNTGNNDLNADIWQEEGHWLLLPLIFFAALWSRKGWIAAVIPFAIPFLLVTTVIGMPATAHAESAAKTPPLIDTGNLWFSPDQKAMKAFAKGKTKEAAETFTRPEWKASAYYRAGDYQAAAKTLENHTDSESLYNKANALAKLGKFEQAIKAYDKAIESDADNEDAKYNREQVKQALEKQQQQQQNEQQNDQQQDNQQQDSEQKDTENSDANQQNDEQQQDQQNKDQQEGGNKESQPDSQDSSTDSDQQQNQEEKSGESSSEAKNNDSDKQNENNQQQNSAQDQQREQTENEQLKNRDADAEKKQQQQEMQQYQQDQQDQQQQDNEQNKQQQQSETIEN